MNRPPRSVFVYGTLQRGECRAAVWPCHALEIQAATAPGALLDLGEFPARIEGTDRILGELRLFDSTDLQRTLETLDAVEGYRQPGERDLYVRHAIECTTLDGDRVPAYTYSYARPAEIAGATPVAADSDGLVHWRRLIPRGQT